MLPITKVSSLILELSEAINYSEIIKRIQIPFSEFSEYLNWNEQYYTRNCIVRTDQYELLVLCWEPGQFSPIHSHNKQECWVYIVEGELNELQFQLNKQNLPEQFKAESLTKNNFYYTNDDLGLHSLSNLSSNRCVSLHLYAKPIDECQYFSEETNSFKTKSLNYSSTK